MNRYVTGKTIKYLREKNKLTQLELSKKLNISDKTVSKWETGRGYPDISLLEPIAKVFQISISELIAGVIIQNENKSSNLLKSKFYICPVCGNIIHSMGQTSLYCHGIELQSEVPIKSDKFHKIFIEKVEDEYYVTIEHEMKKSHYISFILALSAGNFEMYKLYPEQNPEVRFKINGIQKILYYCNRDGLFYEDISKKLII